MKDGMQSKLMYPNINSDKSIIFDLDSFPETRVQFTDAFYYDQRNMKPHILHLQEGIDKFPNFIKMRFLLMSYYEKISDYESYIDQFEDFLVVYKDKNIKLVGCCEGMVGDTKNHVFSILQNNFFRMSSDVSSIYKRLFLHQYANLLIKYFPKKAEAYSNKGGLLALSLDDKNALKYFLKAYKLNKSDSIVLFNIAATYSNLKKFKKSLTFYKKALHHAVDDHEKREIQNEIDALTNYLNAKG